MSKHIVRSFIDVGNQLTSLGTSRELLLEVVEAAVGAANESTENDPSGTRGWRRWQMGTRRLREAHIGLEGWDRDDTEQIASIVDTRRGIRLVVCNTDDATCIEGRDPKNRAPKGSATDRSIDINHAQTSFMDILDATVIDMRKWKRPEGSVLTYVLCIYHEADDIRAELSCAVEASGGFFKRFSQRIFITGGESGEPEPVKRKGPDHGPEFDIQVTRKK